VIGPSTFFKSPFLLHIWCVLNENDPVQDYPISEYTQNETLIPKLRGGYYTPTPIARFLAEWAVRDKQDRILEPSCGDGQLVVAATQQLLELGATPIEVAQQVRATELFDSEAAIARERLIRQGLNGFNIVSTGDFFTALGGQSNDLFSFSEAPLTDWRFEAVIGNPPFLRYHTFPEEQRKRAFMEMQQAGLQPTRLTNAWVPFLVASAQRLTPQGRLAMVIPAELLQVGYAGETRAYLARFFASITIVTFRKLVFETIQQEVVLILAERGEGNAHVIDIVELNDLDDLPTLSSQLQIKHSHKPLTQAADKWTMYFLSPAEIELMQQLAKRTDLPRLHQFAKVEVGVVTGNNSFFVQREQDVIQRGLHGFVHPLVGRTAQLPGLTYAEPDHEKQRLAGVGCWLLDIPSTTSLNDSLKSYLEEGEKDAVQTGYKCRIRPSWYSVPSIWTPDGFLFRQIYRYPKLVANYTQATTTDTVHRVRLNKAIDIGQLAGSFYNILTFAFAEIMGRSYGGGVLELEPREAGHLPIPFFSDTKLDIEKLDALERKGRGSEILEETNQILKSKLGLDQADCKHLTHIWKKLSERRTGRKSAAKRNLEI
jgi:adenine-specific DNA-methyltransferase